MLGNRQIRMMKRDISERGTHLFPPARMRHPTTPGYGQILGAVPGDHLRQAGAPEEFGILLANPSTLAPRRRSANPSPPRRDLGCWYAPPELSCQAARPEASAGVSSGRVAAPRNLDQ